MGRDSQPPELYNREAGRQMNESTRTLLVTYGLIALVGLVMIWVMVRL